MKIMMKSGGLGLAVLLAIVLPGAAPNGDPQDLEGPGSPGWPRVIDAGEAQITVYPPQVDSLKGDRLRIRAAVSVSRTGAPEPLFGSLWVEGKLITDASRGIAVPLRLAITESRFPAAGAAEAAQLRQALAFDLPQWGLAYSLDRLFAELKLLEERKATAQGLLADPPEILFVSHPAVLLSIEGEPAWRAWAGTPYRRLANSAFFVIQDPGTGTCYLHIAPFWWISTDPRGPWQAIDGVPAAVEALGASEGGPEDEEATPDPRSIQRPEVIVRTEPAELILTQGPLQFSPITGTNLLYVKNTESDVFIEIQSQVYYVLLSGRWYRKPVGGKQPWTFVPAEDLPIDFSRIPLSSEKQQVLACVAGTLQSRQALLSAEVPQTAAIPSGPAPDLSVTYGGVPQFSELTDCHVAYAVNSPYSIFFARQRYFCCQDGIWYDSGSALGPWFVCSDVPSEIYLIPPSCPLYYCTYCTVFCAAPGIVYFGCYPGYRGCYVWGSTPVFGTGWRYTCWTGTNWYPRPITWGVGVRFDGTTCDWSFRLGAGGPCAWMGLGHSFGGRAPAVSVGVGGWWGGVRSRRAEIDIHRTASLATSPGAAAEHNVYSRHPANPALAPARPSDPATPARTGPKPPASGGPDSPGIPSRPRSAAERHATPDAGQPDPRPSAPAVRRESQYAPPPPPPRENPRTPPPPSRTEAPRTPPPPPPPPPPAPPAPPPSGSGNHRSTFPGASPDRSGHRAMPQAGPRSRS